MGAVQDERRRRASGGPVNDDPSSAYLHDVRTALHLPRRERRRAIEEISNHLDDGVAAHTRTGATQQQAVALAISELGAPKIVAAAYNEDASDGSDSTGLWRWLPLIPPVALFIEAIAFLVSSLRWIGDGWTAGEQTVQRSYLMAVVISGALSFGTYLSIKRATRDAAWRWAAWLGAGVAIAIVAVRAL
jgi:hypothetical protein